MDKKTAKKSTGILAPQYRDEDAAREYIEKERWPDGPVCPHCGTVDEATKLEPREGSKKAVRKGVWNCNACREQFTVTIGSIFEDSHIPLHKWLLAIHLMVSSKKGISAHQLQRNLELGSYRSAWFMAHRIRWGFGQEPLRKLDGIIEIDETYVGGKLRVGPQRDEPGQRPKDRPSATANKASVVSVLQRGGEVRSQHVERVTAENLRPIVDQFVSDDAHIMTDTSTVLASATLGRRHSQVNHNAKEYVRHEDGLCVTTNTVEGYFSILKRGNYGVYHHWGKKYMDQYLREFDWRYNARKLPDMERAIIALKATNGKRLMLRTPKAC